MSRNRLGCEVPRRRQPAASGVVLTIGVAIHQASLLGLLNETFGWNCAVALICGMGGAVTLLHIIPRGRSLRTIGRSSYATYLYHTSFTDGARILLHRLGGGDGILFPAADPPRPGRQNGRAGLNGSESRRFVVIGAVRAARVA